MILSLLAIGAVILVAIAMLIRRDLIQLDTQERLKAILHDRALPETEPPDSFQDDRIVAGQFVPIGEYHCRGSGGSCGKWKGGKRKTKKKVWRYEND